MTEMRTEGRPYQTKIGDGQHLLVYRERQICSLRRPLTFENAQPRVNGRFGETELLRSYIDPAESA